MVYRNFNISACTSFSQHYWLMYDYTPMIFTIICAHTNKSKCTAVPCFLYHSSYAYTCSTGNTAVIRNQSPLQMTPILFPRSLYSYTGLLKTSTHLLSALFAVPLPCPLPSPAYNTQSRMQACRHCIIRRSPASYPIPRFVSTKYLPFGPFFVPRCAAPLAYPLAHAEI